MTRIEAGKGPERRKKKRAWPFVVLGLLFSLGVLALVAWVLLPGFVLRVVEREAKAQGVLLRDCSLDFSLERVVLTGCAFELVAVPGVSGTIGKATIDLADFEPRRVAIEEAAVVVRELPDVPTGERIPTWLEQRAKLGKQAKIPISITRSRLDLFGVDEAGKPDGAALVTLTNLEYDSESESVKGDIAIGGVITGTFAHAGTRSDLDVSLKMSPSTRGRFSVETEADGAVVRADFQGLPLGLFAMPPLFSWPEELSAVVVDGQVYTTVPFGLSTKGIGGDFRFTLSDMPMPVPREIQGLVYGPQVAVSGKFKLNDNYKQLDVPKLVIQAGVLTLKGDARVELRGLRVPLTARLRGALSCGAILEAATKAHTDSPLFINAAKLARKAVLGNVDILVALDADLLKLDQAKLLRTIGVGCGLQPLPVPDDLRALGDRILKDLPRPPVLEVPDLTLPTPPRFELPELPDLRRRRNLREGEGTGTGGAGSE